MWPVLDELFTVLAAASWDMGHGGGAIAALSVNGFLTDTKRRFDRCR